MKRKISASPSALVREIAVLREATSANLKERWRALYRTEPPRRISRDLLIRALAYRIQEKALGGLKPSTRRLLTKVAADASARRPIQVAPEPDSQTGNGAAARVARHPASGDRPRGRHRVSGQAVQVVVSRSRTESPAPSGRGRASSA